MKINLHSILVAAAIMMPSQSFADQNSVFDITAPNARKCAQIAIAARHGDDLLKATRAEKLNVLIGEVRDYLTALEDMRESVNGTERLSVNERIEECSDSLKGLLS